MLNFLNIYKLMQALFLGLCFSVISCDSKKSASYRVVEGVVVYDTFPNFQEVLKKRNDTVYVINFWATWCMPCVKELPYLEQLPSEYMGKPIKVVLVSLDAPKEIKGRLIPFVKERSIKSEVIVLNDLKVNNWGDAIDPKWMGEIPITYIYHKNSSVSILKAFDSYSDLENQLKQFLTSNS